MKRFFAGAIAGSLIVLAAIAIARATPPIAPTGDGAVIENYVIQAGEGRLLVGPYSRFQWHHPGPLYFYLLSPFYAASGHRTAGLSAGAVVLNLGALVLAVWIAAMAGDARLAAALAAVVVLYVCRVSDLLTSAWNPHIIVFATMALVVTCAAAADGRVWLLPLVAFLASAVAQTDVGVLPVAVLLGGLALIACLATSAWSAPRRRTALATTFVVLALSWLLPAVEQFAHTPGNLTALWTFFSHGDGGGQPLPVAVAAWADMLSGPFRPGFYLAHGWMLTRSHAVWPRAWAIAQLILLAIASALSLRARRRFLMWLAAFLFAASLAALWAVTRIEGGVMDHEVFWISGLGVLNTAVIADAVSRLLWPGERRLRPSLLLATSGVLVLVCVIVAFTRLDDVRTRALVPSRETTAIQTVTPAIQEYLRREGVERPMVMVDQNSWGLAAGVLLELQKMGVSYSVEDDWVPMFSDAARATGRERMTLSIAGAERHLLLRSQPGTVVVAERDPIFVDTIPPPHR